MNDQRNWEEKNINFNLYREEISPFKKIEDQKKECQICFEKFNSDSFIKCTKSCFHQFCKQCTIQYLKNQIKIETEDIIRCPQLNCKDYISEQYLLNGDLTMEIQMDYILLKLNKMIKNDPHCFFCPSIQCNGRQVLRKDLQKKDQIIQCKFCEKHFCFQCKQQHQAGKQCQNLTDSTEVNVLPNYEKKCPTCEKQQAKKSGCNKIKCIQCKQYFCWLCIQKLEKNDQHYDEIEGYLHCRGKLYDLSEVIWSSIWSVIQFLLENKFYCLISVIIYLNCNNILSFNGQVCLMKFDYNFFFYDLILMNIYSEVILFIPQNLEIHPLLVYIAIYIMDILLGQTFLYQIEFISRLGLNLIDSRILEDYWEFFGQIQEKFIVINLNAAEKSQYQKEFYFLFLLIMNIIILLMCVLILTKIFKYEVDYYRKSDLNMLKYIGVKVLDLIIVSLMIYISLAFLLYGIPFLKKNIYSLLFFVGFYWVDEQLLINIFVD